MLNLKSRFIHAHLSAYVNGELTPPLRRYIARQLDHNPDLWHEYQRQRTIKETFEHQLAFMPKPTHARMDAIWANIQQEMTQTSRPQPTHNPKSLLAYGTISFLVVLSILIPLNARSLEGNSLTLPSQPAPRVMMLSATPTAHHPPTTYIASTQNALYKPFHINDELANTPHPQS